MDFQARRRRATKLIQFFGVDYRELIKDVLESIEGGLEHERKRGTLNPDEAEVNMQNFHLSISDISNRNYWLVLESFELSEKASDVLHFELYFNRLLVVIFRMFSRISSISIRYYEKLSMIFPLL